MFVRSYAYILSLGSDGLQEASETAVLNANYLLAKLRELGVTEHLPPAYDRLCMHEFVLSGAPMKRELGLRTLDLAKRLLDFGFHPPTVYFPLLVDEALLVEPTETETRETLDAFAEALASILREGAEDPEIARNAPYGTPVRRLDEAGAAKRPVIRQPLYVNPGDSGVLKLSHRFSGPRCTGEPRTSNNLVRGGNPCQRSAWPRSRPRSAAVSMLVGGTGIASAQDSPARLTQVVPVTGTKNFKGTYTIERFVKRGNKVYSVGTIKGKVGDKRVTKENVRMPGRRVANASAVPRAPARCRCRCRRCRPATPARSSRSTSGRST